jgi:hypothetical protein
MAHGMEMHLPAIWNWGAGIVALTLVGMGIQLQTLHALFKHGLSRQADMIEKIIALETMHQHPDDFQFGTKDTNAMLNAMTKECRKTCQRNREVADSIDNLAALIRYDIKQRTGLNPPPNGTLRKL